MLEKFQEKFTSFIPGKKTHSLIAVLGILAASAGVDFDVTQATQSLDALFVELQKMIDSFVVIVGIVQGFAHMARNAANKADKA